MQTDRCFQRGNRWQILWGNRRCRVSDAAWIALLAIAAAFWMPTPARAQSAASHSGPAFQYPVWPDSAGACVGPNLVYNGGFEQGFSPAAVGSVGNNWGFFTNGGGAAYGFYDDQWPRALAEGRHSQLIEINTNHGLPADNDRYAGIYQYLAGLHPGVTYEFRVSGLLRGEGDEKDPYRFAVQWGYLPGYSGEWQAVNNWTELNLGPVEVRTDPGAAVNYTMRFVAQSPEITLFLRGWKKWGIPYVEMDLNIDNVAVVACGGHGGPVVSECPVQGCPAPHLPVVEPIVHECSGPCGGPVVVPECPVQGCQATYPPVVEPIVHECSGACGEEPWWPVETGSGCTHTVRPGEMLAKIAYHRGVSLYALSAANGIWNQDLILAGQQLVLPGCKGGHSAGPMGAYHPETHIVQPGETLSELAVWYGVTFDQMMAANGLRNPNKIYVGQQLIIP